MHNVSLINIMNHLLIYQNTIIYAAIIINHESSHS